MATEKLNFRFPTTDIAIVTTYHYSRRIPENTCPKLDNSERERMLQLDKGQYHNRSRPMTTLLLFAVAIVVAAVAQTTLSPRMP